MRKSFSAAESKFAKNILNEIESGAISTRRDLSIRCFFWSKELALREMPSYPFILSNSPSPSKLMLELLSVKPTRSVSGVQVVAVMLPPFPCPGKCIYCPSSIEGRSAPKSYTGFEPSALRAQRLNYDPFKIVSNRVAQLDATGNRAEKIELIFQGSSFTALPKSRQSCIVKKCLDAINSKKSVSFAQAKALAEKSSAQRRVVGITFETRPDLCNKRDVEQLLSLGGTRVELGVQNTSDDVYKKIKRGHLVSDVVNSTALLKDSAFKVLYHLMPGLPGSSFDSDLKNFSEIFTNPNFKPDMVKFYPCLVIKGTKLYEDWKKGIFTPVEEDYTVRLLAEIKSNIPRWVRVMRVNRDIPSTVISAGVKKTNLRQLVEEELASHSKKCNCIRCREYGIVSREGVQIDVNAKISSEFYDASKGKEAFISSESSDALFGFVRLRKPALPFVKEITPRTALVRELHVFGRALALGERDEQSAQHKGLGKELMHEAQRIAKEEFDANKLIVISGLGVKDYYKKNFNFKKQGPYMSKKI